MADRGSRGDGSRTGRERLRKLTQAALNADETVDQVEGILGDMGEVLVGLGGTIGTLEGTFTTFDASLVNLSTTMTRVDGMADQVEDLMYRLEAIVARVERIVGIVDTALAPVSAVESVGRGVASMLGLGRRA